MNNPQWTYYSLYYLHWWNIYHRTEYNWNLTNKDQELIYIALEWNKVANK